MQEQGRKQLNRPSGLLRIRASAMVAVALIGILFATATEVVAQGQAIRTWRDATGQFSIRARLIRKTEDAVTLLKSDGREVSVPLSRLSDRDRAHLNADEAGSAKKASPSATSKAIAQVLAGLSLPPAKIGLADLPKLLQIPVFIDKRELEEIGLAVDIPVNLKGGHGSFREQLDDALDPIDFAWCTTQTVLVITTGEGMEEFATTKFYRVPTPRGAVNRGAPVFNTTGVVQNFQRVAPDSWEVMGGAGSITPLAVPVYSVRQTPSVHRQLTEEITCQPIPHQYGHPFDLQSVTLSVRQTSLENVVTSIAEQLGVSVEFASSLAEMGLDASGPRMSLELENVSGKDALDLVLSQEECTWVEQDNKLVIHSEDFAEENLSTQRITANLGPMVNDSRFIQAIVLAVAPDTWDVLGGEGQIRSVRPGVYIVQQGQPAMREVEQWMRDLNALR